MAFENFTTYAETDPGADIAVAANTITWTALDVRNTDSWVVRDFGAGHFSSDFTHTFKVRVTAFAGTSPFAAVWALANSVNDLWAIDDAGGDYQSILLVNSGGTYGLQLRVCENGTVGLATVNIAAATTYFVTIERDDDGEANGTGQLTLRVYTGNYYGQAGAVEVGTVTRDCAADEQNDFQYLYATCTLRTGDTGRTLTVWWLPIGA